LKKVCPPQNQAEFHHVRRVRYGVVSTSLNRGQNDVAIPFIAESNKWRGEGQTRNFVDQVKGCFRVALAADRSQIQYNDVGPKLGELFALEFTAALYMEGRPKSPRQGINET
jgi:hypothetical protein